MFLFACNLHHGTLSTESPVETEFLSICIQEMSHMLLLQSGIIPVMSTFTQQRRSMPVGTVNHPVATHDMQLTLHMHLEALSYSLSQLALHVVLLLCAAAKTCLSE